MAQSRRIEARIRQSAIVPAALPDARLREIDLHANDVMRFLQPGAQRVVQIGGRCDADVVPSPARAVVDRLDRLMYNQQGGRLGSRCDCTWILGLSCERLPEAHDLPRPSQDPIGTAAALSIVRVALLHRIIEGTGHRSPQRPSENRWRTARLPSSFRAQSRVGLRLTVLDHTVLPGGFPQRLSIHPECRQSAITTAQVIFGEGGYLCRYVIRPFVRSYGDISSETLSPFMILMRFRRSLPAIVARIIFPASSSIENIPALNFSTTLPITSIASSFGNLFLIRHRPLVRHFSCRTFSNSRATSGFGASLHGSRHHTRGPIHVRSSGELR